MAGTPVAREIFGQLQHTSHGFASMQEFRSASLGSVISRLEAASPDIYAANWDAALSAFQEYSSPSDPGYTKAIAMLTAFANGDFSAWKEGLLYYGDLTATYPRSMSMGEILDDLKDNPTPPVDWDVVELEQVADFDDDSSFTWTSDPVPGTDFVDDSTGDGDDNSILDRIVDSVRDMGSAMGDAITSLTRSWLDYKDPTGGLDLLGDIETAKQVHDLGKDTVELFGKSIKAFDDNSPEDLEQAFGDWEQRYKNSVFEKIPLIGEFFKKEASFSLSQSDVFFNLHYGGTVRFGEHRDTYVGNNATNQIFLGSNDDVAFAGIGKDMLKGEAGSDMLFGGAQMDRLVGNRGADHLAGNGGSDRIFGGGGNDVIQGGYGGDRAYGGLGRDDMSGERGNDTLFGGAHDDIVYGQVGDDILRGQGGGDTLRGGAGSDLAKGGRGKDKLIGGGASDDLQGGGGRDALRGGGGPDAIDGQGGNDIYVGGSAHDTFVFNRGLDTIRDFQAKDVIDLSGADGIRNFRDLRDNHLTTRRVDLLIHDRDGDGLVLENTALSQLDTDTFLF